MFEVVKWLKTVIPIPESLKVNNLTILVQNDAESVLTVMKQINTIQLKGSMTDFKDQVHILISINQYHIDLKDKK